MLKRRRRPLIAAVGLIAVGALALSTPAAAQPTYKGHPGDARIPASWGHKAPVVPINITTTDGFKAPKSIHAGFVTFKVSSSESTYHALQIMRVNHGSTLAQVMADFNLGLSDSRADNALGARQLVKDATLMGGVVTSSYAPMSVTVPLTPGTYYLFDQNEVGGTTPVRIHTLKATGRMDWAGMPRFSSVVGMVIDNMDMPRFVAPTSMKADGNILMYGQGDELHEAVFRPILPNVDDAYITQYYKDLDAGLPHAPSPWTDLQHGLQAMSPGQFAVFHVDLPPGHYALVCLVPDDETGLAHSHMGMHQVVDLH